MREEFYSAVLSAPAEDVPAALDAALQAAYENHPRDSYAAGLASLKASAEAREKAAAEAEVAAKAQAEAEAAAVVPSAVDAA